MEKYILFFLLYLLLKSSNCIKSNLEDNEKSDDIIIIHTNDVHCGVQDNIGYDGLMLYKKQLQQKYKDVLVVDCGDHLQGATIGLLTQGEDIIDMMNEIGYDAAVLGNHEFDYGVEQMKNCEKKLNCGYISANFFERKNKTSSIFPGYKIIELNNTKKIAFIGVTTPQTLSISSIIKELDENKTNKYDFLTERNGSELYEEIQKNIDAAKSENADYIIMIAHSGKDSNSLYQYTTVGMMENLENVDAVLDGHTHQVYSTVTPDKNGKKIILAQTGTKFNYIGVLTIHSDGTLSHKLLNSIPIIDDTYDKDSYTSIKRGQKEIFVDNYMYKYINNKIDSHKDILNKLIGYSPFSMYIGSGESTLGNLITDSFRKIGNADISIMNSGTIRANLYEGNIIYQNILDIIPFSNGIEVKNITGLTILDALEFGVSDYPSTGRKFPQISGITFKFNKDIKSSVVVDSSGNFVEVSGQRRVFDVMIGNQHIDKEKYYTFCSHNFITRGGDGYSMFINYEPIETGLGIDNEVLIDYIQKELNGNIPYNYQYTEGRIIITENNSVENLKNKLPLIILLISFLI